MSPRILLNYSKHKHNCTKKKYDFVGFYKTLFTHRNNKLLISTFFLANSTFGSVPFSEYLLFLVSELIT